LNTVIACGSIKPELEKIKADSKLVRVKYLPQNLHRNPNKLKSVLQNTINNVEANAEKVILGFGLCSNAIVGIIAPKQGLYIPKVHDCISFYFGSSKKYKKLFKKYPGTYYLTKSWIINKKDPLGLMEGEYTERVGKELAEETIRKEIENYKYISFIDTAGDNSEDYLKIAKKNAEYFNKEFMKYEANNEYFEKILFGPYDEPDFIYIKAGEKVLQKEFLK